MFSGIAHIAPSILTFSRLHRSWILRVYTSNLSVLSGGAAAAFEPLSEHLLEYEWALAQYLGYGVAACYRGPRSVLLCASIFTIFILLF